MAGVYDKFYEAFRGEQDESKVLLEERRTLQTTLGTTNDELIEEMKKHGITCIKMDAGSDDPDAKPLYVRLTENNKRTGTISIKTIGDTLFGREDEDDENEEEDNWAQKVEEAYAQVQEINAAKKEKEKKQKAEDKKRVEKRKRKVKEIKKRKAEEDAKKLKEE